MNDRDGAERASLKGRKRPLPIVFLGLCTSGLWTFGCAGLELRRRDTHQREYKEPDAEPEHDDDQLTHLIVPIPAVQVHGDRRQQINVSGYRDRNQRHLDQRSEVAVEWRAHQREPADLGNDECTEPEAPSAKCRSSWSE